MINGMPQRLLRMKITRNISELCLKLKFLQLGGIWKCCRESLNLHDKILNNRKHTYVCHKFGRHLVKHVSFKLASKLFFICR